MDDDAALMLRVQSGDRHAFDQLVRRYQTPLLNFFYKLIWNRQEAEDFAQDVFVKVYVARAAYKVQAKFSTYLFRIATNYWIDYLRTRGRHGKPVSLQTELTAGKEAGSLQDVLDSGALPPEEELIRSEQMERAQAAIDDLPEMQKMVFLLAEVQGMKYQEIADTLDIPLGTVKSRMYAAVMKLKEIFVSQGIV